MLHLGSERSVVPVRALLRVPPERRLHFVREQAVGVGADVRVRMRPQISIRGFSVAAASDPRVVVEGRGTREAVALRSAHVREILQRKKTRSQNCCGLHPEAVTVAVAGGGFEVST